MYKYHIITRGETISNKKYKCILADPPWSYDNKKTGRDMKHGAEAKYPTMPLEDICNMDVKSISDKDSCLFLWATTPLLPEAFEVMRSWGFKYKTAIYWDKKTNGGLGYWFRGGVEVCLFGCRGKLKAFRSQSPNIISERSTKHSRKPDGMYKLIETLDLDPKIELFAREQREGWNSWGNQIPTTMQKMII